MNLHKSKTKTSWFTLIEIVVSATILVILTSIGFYSYTKNISDARDSARTTDISSLQSQLSLYKRERWAYPFPGDYFNITNGTPIVALQWKMNNKVSLTTADNLPLDPELDIPYVYSTTKNRQEFQISWTMENSDSPFAILAWNYKSISRNTLPNIVIAFDGQSDTDISLWNSERDLFIFDKGIHTLPYDFDTWAPYTDWSSFDTILASSQGDYWQNTDYRSCGEIEIAGKNITASWSQEYYQILSSTWALEDVECDGIIE